MRKLWKQMVPLHPQAMDVALTGLRMAALLMSCQICLLVKAHSLSVTTYHLYQMIDFFKETTASVLLITVIGVLWLQSLYSKS